MTTKKTTLIWTIGVVIVLVLWATNYFYFVSCNPHLSWADRGNIGQMFGVVSALFAGLAFLAVVITLYIQSRELSATRSDVEVQKFETKFFQLIRIQNNILDGIGNYQMTAGQAIPIRGWLRMVKLYEQYVSDYKSAWEQSSLVGGPDHLIKTSYSIFFERNQPEIGHYFRHLYNIVAFVDRATFLTFHQKKSYTKLIRAQMSSHELLLLFYNCLSKRGIKKFKPLVEKYSLLEHMPDDRLVPAVLQLKSRS